jgi:hypothetical protein
MTHCLPVDLQQAGMLDSKRMWTRSWDIHRGCAGHVLQQQAAMAHVFWS